MSNFVKYRLPALAACALFAFTAIPAVAVDGGGQDTAIATQAPGYAEAKAATDAKQHRKAINILAALVNSDPNNADAWNLLGYNSRKLKRYDDAAKYYRAALQLDPKHLGALEYQGELFLETGAAEKARANLNRLKALCGDCEEYLDLKEALEKAGQS